MEIIELNTIYNEDCFLTIEKIKQCWGRGIDIVLTSPPYNTGRPGSKNYKGKNRYDFYKDRVPNEQYINWTIDLFNSIHSILKDTGTIIYNISYGSENPALLWLTIAAIIEKTGFITVDFIAWKKKQASPNNMSSNKLTRIVEPVFIFCKKGFEDNFFMNKKHISHRKTGQINFENVFNIIEAANNDGENDINKATFSTEFVRKLLKIYAKKGFLIFDPFTGTGTTQIGCLMDKCNFIGSEISKKQYDFANQRIKLFNDKPTLF